MRSLLVAVVLWGVANFLLKLGRMSLNTSSVQAAQCVGVMIGVVMFYALARQQISPLGGYLISYGVSFLAGVCGFTGTYFFLDALGIEKLSFASQLGSLHIVVATLLGVLFLKEALGVWEIIGGLLMIVGATLLGISK